MKLAGLATEHPGGWNDILANIAVRWPDIKLDIGTNMWKATTKVVDKDGRQQDTGVSRLARDFVDVQQVDLHGYLANLEFPVSGLLAAEAYRVLQSAGLPTPGDPQWKQPASGWRRKHA